MIEKHNNGFGSIQVKLHTSAPIRYAVTCKLNFRDGNINLWIGTANCQVVSVGREEHPFR
jgi:hypothetical protein